MKKIIKNKEAIIVVLFYIITFLLIFLAITHNKNIFASTTDFDSQHYLLPEYFRNLFYSNFDLAPDFALNLGGGINIFYLSYYGLLSPIIYISYLMPDVPMIYYIIISTSFLTVFSSILFYFYLRKRYSFLASFLGGFLFLLASPLIFHSHRHIMFVNYFCFLIMGMFGVDKYFEKNSIILLTISIFLIIMTSYYYSVGALLCLFLLGIYKYINETKKVEIKDIFNYMLPFIIGIMMGCLIILPTIYVLLNSRAGSGTSVNLLSLFIPNLGFKYILYNPYGPGAFFISLLAAFYYSFKGNKGDKLLSIFILLIGSFPLFNYLLNGTLYIDSKSLIPLLPLIIIITTHFLDDIFNNKIDFYFVIKLILNIIILAFIQLLIDYFVNFKNNGLIDILDSFGITIILILEAFFFIVIWYFNYYKKRKKGIFLYLIIMPIILSLGININDQLVSRKFYQKEIHSQINDAINTITQNDKSFYRINTAINEPDSFNKISNISQYQTSIYSSTNNKYYNELFYDIFNNNVVHRNRAMIPSSSNPLYNDLMGEKYVITRHSYDGTLLYNYNHFNVYLNKEAFPIGYVNNKIINQKDFDNLNYPSKELNTLNAVISTSDKTNTDILQINSSQIDYKILDTHNLKFTKINNKERIISSKGYMFVKLNNIPNDSIIFLDFKNYNNPSCSSKDLEISINKQKNKLTCKNWKYHNQNYIFHYTLKSAILLIEFGDGEYLLGDFHLYYLPNSNYNYLYKNVDKFVTTKKSGDQISGYVKSKSNGYFVIQIPYDKGFTIKLDNKKVKYQNVNNGLIGFKITKGYHKVNIKYHAPYKDLGVLINLIGLSLLIVFGAKKDYNFTSRKKAFKWKKLIKRRQ